MLDVSEVAARLTRPQKSIGCEDVSEVATWLVRGSGLVARRHSVRPVPQLSKIAIDRMWASAIENPLSFPEDIFFKLSSCMYASPRLELCSQGLHFWSCRGEGTTISLIVCQRCGSEKCNSDYPSGPPVKKNAPHSQTLFKACSEYFGFAIVPPTSLQQDRYYIKSQGCEWRR
ncbi:uncharacterized protein EI90DRAFT_3059983 [Cantharellus anzutake]|uniref:uncharacterized protein n=1 Tax=Cantharellus anzutake TaxID=1750568 RepID=UPI001902F031|nr:uncharacterized protein EI90DRAFT_3059983 [Cantharellus anzutake]KAF8330567.1 hypothetical protein EI90DRAFT_3059983 [Cantharellus anzutake]